MSSVNFCKKLFCGILILLLLLSAAACEKTNASKDPTKTGEPDTDSDCTCSESCPEGCPEDCSGSCASTDEDSSVQGGDETGTGTETETETEMETDEDPSDSGTQTPDVSDGIVKPSEQGYTYPEMVDDLALLAQTYGEYFSYQSIGKSVDGREIFACVVGNPEAEHRVLLTGGIHGKEYLSSLLVMTQVEYYLANRESGSYNGLSYADMMQTHAFYVLPMINPDGIMLALCGIDSMQTDHARETVEKIYAENLRDGLTTATDIDDYLAYNWKSNANGVDLNRNFALSNWEEVKTGILAPCFRNYKGPRPASEPETQAVSAYVESIGEIEALLAFHTAGQVVYWDCGMTGGVRLDTYDLAQAVCEHTGYKMIYDAHLDASLNDWITLEKGVPSVTVEIAAVIYPMPTSELADAFEQTKELWVITAQLFG